MLLCYKYVANESHMMSTWEYFTCALISILGYYELEQLHRYTSNLFIFFFLFENDILLLFSSRLNLTTLTSQPLNQSRRIEWGRLILKIQASDLFMLNVSINNGKQIQENVTNTVIKFNFINLNIIKTLRYR